MHWAALHWRARARAARRSFTAWFVGETKRWACIHGHEGRWDDHGLPQMGGLQMDPQFQLDYGSEFVHRWGDAGYWPIWAQYVAAERAFRGYQSPYKRAYIPARGFGPWTTARDC